MLRSHTRLIDSSSIGLERPDPDISGMSGSHMSLPWLGRPYIGYVKYKEDFEAALAPLSSSCLSAILACECAIPATDATDWLLKPPRGFFPDDGFFKLF
jgi:hypothetical protein